jgi:hypothetical protein
VVDQIFETTMALKDLLISPARTLVNCSGGTSFETNKFGINRITGGMEMPFTVVLVKN